MGSRTRLLALLVAIAAAPPSVRAEPPPLDEAARVGLARRHYQAGSAYFEEGRFDEAAREFRESYRLAPRPDLLYNVAQSYLRQGDAARAMEFYRRYLEADPKARDRAAIEATVAGLARQVGRVRVVNAPPGAEVLVDGAPVGVAPLAEPVEASAGRARVEVRAGDGSGRRAIEVAVAPGAEVVADFAPPPPPAPTVIVRERVVERVVERRGPRWYLSKPGWALAGAGAALLVVGGALLGASATAAADGRAATTEGDWRAANDRAGALQWSGATLLAIGGASLAGGAIAFLVAARRAHRAEPALSLWLAPDGAGLVARGRF
ncbi:MAG TPA: tetratricopeptide repeat protein [Polyangiaceae bacterium]|nr:tetratricopeptide repeat protein [Polyangiaceae bacterium]